MDALETGERVAEHVIDSVCRVAEDCQLELQSDRIRIDLLHVAQKRLSCVVAHLDGLHAATRRDDDLSIAADELCSNGGGREKGDDGDDDKEEGLFCRHYLCCGTCTICFQNS